MINEKTDQGWRARRAEFYQRLLTALGLDPKMRVSSMQIQIRATGPAVVVTLEAYAPSAHVESLAQVFEEYLPALEAREKEIRIVAAERPETWEETWEEDGSSPWKRNRTDGD